MQKLLTVTEVAARTGWSEKTIRQRVWLRSIEFVRLGRSIRFKPETIEAMIDESTVPPLPERAARCAGR